MGYPAVFTASSIALAVLETLVHTDLSIMPRHRVVTIDVPDELSRTTVDRSQLPEDWQSSPPPSSLQMIGRSWLHSGETALLQVPSAIVPQEWNLILNPLHAEFGHLVIDTDQAFDFDPRLRANRSDDLRAASERSSDAQ
jgi:RES domain-containing protein